MFKKNTKKITKSVILLLLSSFILIEGFNHYKRKYKRSRYRKFIYIRKGSDTLISYQFYSKELHWLEIEDGFFDGWPNPPNKDKHREIMEKSYKTLVAIDEKSNKIIGFINAISDGVLAAYIPFLEVLLQYQNQGIGSELVERMLGKLEDFYMVDLCCDKELQPFYEKLNMHKSFGMIHRNYKNQSGR